MARKEVDRGTLFLDKERARNAVNNVVQIAEQQNGRLINKFNLKTGNDLLAQPYPCDLP